MQGYTWSSNQRPPRNDQGCPPPQYQGRPPPQYQEQRPPPHYQEWSPLHYQEQCVHKYQDARNEQSNMFQAQFNTQICTTSQTRYSDGQQHAVNQCTPNYFVPPFQPNLHGYNAQTNRAHPQYSCAAPNTQQHYPSENTNRNGYNGQFVTQSNASPPQNYRNAGHNQAHMYQSPQSDHGSSKGNKRGWKFHNYNHGGYMNNQQQLQPPIAAPHHHQKQQQFPIQHSGKQHNMHHHTQGHHPRSSSWAHNKNISNNQAPSQVAPSYTSCNSTTPPSGTQSNISLPSNNLNQSPVNENQPELRSTADQDALATQSQNNQSTEQLSQGTNNETHNVTKTSQMTRTDEAHDRFNSLIYKLLFSKRHEQHYKQQSDERIVHNTCSEQSEVCATNRTDHHSKEPFSQPSAQCTVEPPSKRMYTGDQRNYWNTESIISKERSDFGAQSVRPGTHQMGINENRPMGTSQQNILYSTDPADCLEAVFALQKVSQHVHKAIAIVPPISQQTSNTAQMADSSPQKADSPPLKIDSVWSVVEESDVQKTADDKLSKSSSPTAQLEDKSIEIETTSNIADSDICSTNPAECQKKVRQADCDSSDTSFNLSSVPVVKYTLEKLMDLVKSLEIKELSSGCPERPESFFNTILKLYWNGNQAYLVETLKSFRKEIEQYYFLEIIRDYESVVLESIETENLKKLVNCDVLNTELDSPSEEFRSSWLNVDGQPDIEKVLSEPLLDNLTVIKPTSQLLSNNTVVTLGVTSLKDMSKSSSDEKSVKPDTCSPTALFTPRSGSNSEEMAIENSSYSYAGLSRNTSQSCVSRDKETFLSSVSCKKQEAIQQNHSFNTKPNSPLPKRSTENHTDCSDEMEVFRQVPNEQTRHNVSMSNSLPMSPEGNVSDGVKKSEVSFFNENENPGNVEALNNTSDICPVEDVSDDENTGNEVPPISSDICPVEDITDDESTGNEVPPISSDICPVEDVSDDESTGNEVPPMSSDICPVEDVSDDESTGNEVPPMSSDICPVEDITDDENTGNEVPLISSDICPVEDDENTGDQEVLPMSSDIWKVEDISDEDAGNKDTCSNSSDKCVVEDVSSDENSSDDTLLMGITVLSSEDASTFFQHLEDEPECRIKTTTSKFDLPELVACFEVPDRLSHEHNKECVDTCSLCGTKISLSNSTSVTDHDGDLFCLRCWEQAPLLELEEKQCSPMTNKADVLGSPAKSNKRGQDCSPPCLKLEVVEPDVTSTNECIVDIMLTGQRSDQMVASEQGQNSSSTELKVKELKVASPETCIMDEGLTGQKSLIKSQLGQNCSSPYLELKIIEPTVASTEHHTEDERLMGQKTTSLFKSEPRQNCGPPSLELQVKVPNVSSPEKCAENKRPKGQKRDGNVQSELGQSCNRPSFELEISEPTVASTEERTEDDRLMGHKSESLFKSEVRQISSSASFELQVKMPSIASPEECVTDQELTGQKSDSILISVTQKVHDIQWPAEREIQTNDKTNKPPPKKSACFKNKLKSGRIRTCSDEFVLFTPDVIVKKNLDLPGVIAKKRPGGESQDCSNMKKFKEHRQETSPQHRKNLPNDTKKVASCSNDAPPHRSNKEPELHGILSVNKIKTSEPKKVRFDLYGSSGEKQVYAHGRRFSAPATLTISESCTEYSHVLSAKQKVLNQWSSTFIPKTKSFSPRSPRKEAPQKKKKQKTQKKKQKTQKKKLKTQDLLKSNMSALKSHLTHRVKLQSSSPERETNHFRKPGFHQKLKRTLSS